MLKLSSMAVVVKDGKKSAKWWSEKLGFEIRSGEGHWITVAPKGLAFELHLCENDPLEPGNSGIGFVAADVAAEEKKLRALGVHFTRPTTKSAWGTSATFADPDGNEFTINEE
jgi:lactoylglutathione lyase